MEERKNELPIISLILGGVGLFFNGSASVAEGSAMIGFGTLLTLIAFVCAIISLFGRKYKKVCAVIGIVFCIMSFLFFVIWSTDKIKYEAEYEAYWNEYNSRTYTINFDTDGGETLESIVVHPNTYLSPIIPYKSGYEFVNWTLNGAVFNLSGYVNERITSDVTLKANYVKKEITTNNNFNNSTIYNSPLNSKSKIGYQQIYNEYSQKLISAGPTSSINEMADILYEGGTKMAEYMCSATGTDGQYATYESWWMKLWNVYLENCR